MPEETQNYDDTSSENELQEHDAVADTIAEDAAKTEHLAQSKILEAAWEAAKNNDPVGMLERIYTSKFLDGMFNTLRNMERFDDLTDSQLEDAIAEGIDRFYEKVVVGAKIFNFKAYLWKTCQICAIAHFRKQKTWHEVLIEPEELGAKSIPLHKAAAAPIPGQEVEEDPETIDADQRRAAVLHFARSILPRLGTGNVQQVMTCVFNAVEKEVADLSISEIAEATNLKPNTVSVLLKRGFERISREAAKAGLLDPKVAKNLIKSFPLNQ